MKTNRIPDKQSRAISQALRDLTEAICNATGQPESLGFLGGEHGYGAEYESDVFSMMPFYWGDCTCGWEDRYNEWLDNNPHSEDCYQSELTRRGYLNIPGYDDYNPNLPDDHDYLPYKLAQEWGLSDRGCAVHCTCGRDSRSMEWEVLNPHPVTCPVEAPNFHYKPSGTMVCWYKYIGRGMEWNGSPLPKGWLDECLKVVSA